MAQLVDYIVHLYRACGAAQYGGEPVSQLEHALQCAALAEEEGAGRELIVASLLHDVGHLAPRGGPVYASEGNPWFPSETSFPSARTARSVRTEWDDKHEYRPVRMLRREFGDGVVAPIRLHVAAKRYLCAVDPDYRAELSPASLRSLELQGGVFSKAEVASFIAQPYSRDAIRLRTWDDRAKVPGKRTRQIVDYIEMLTECAHGPANTQSAA